MLCFFRCTLWGRADSEIEKNSPMGFRILWKFSQSTQIFSVSMHTLWKLLIKKRIKIIVDKNLKKNARKFKKILGDFLKIIVLSLFFSNFLFVFNTFTNFNFSLQLWWRLVMVFELHRQKFRYFFTFRLKKKLPSKHCYFHKNVKKSACTQNFVAKVLIILFFSGERKYYFLEQNHFT